jgi:hypothetical protein
MGLWDGGLAERGPGRPAGQGSGGQLSCCSFSKL